MKNPKIKDVLKLKIGKDQVLFEVITLNSLGDIILPDSAKQESQYAVIVKLGSDVKEYELGDVILEFGVSKFRILEVNGKDYGILHYDTLKLVTESSNFVIE